MGVDLANDIARSAWAFLIDDLRAASAATFTRRAYVWEGLDEVTVDVIPPCIDPFSVKNVPLGRPDVASILVGAGSLAGANHRVGFTRHDGTQGAISHRAEMVEAAPTPSDAKVVVQVSRWDTLKDPVGVMAGFAQTPELDDAHLILAGPAPSSVGDDPEAVAVLEELRERWAGLREPMRRRIHIANLPADDVEENAVVVNALQRRADVVVQKSLAEGFGLTVTEAMWKARPVVASGLGGIRDQIDDGVHGRLVDPRDLEAFGSAIAEVLGDPVEAASLGENAKRRVEDRFLPTRYLGDYLRLFLALDSAGQIRDRPAELPSRTRD